MSSLELVDLLHPGRRRAQNRATSRPAQGDIPDLGLSIKELIVLEVE